MTSVRPYLATQWEFNLQRRSSEGARIPKRRVACHVQAWLTTYNEDRGGIGFSCLSQLDKTPPKSKRCYCPIFGHALDLSISNAWLIYKRDCSLPKKKPMPLKKFKLQVTYRFLNVRKTTMVGRPSSLSPAELKRRCRNTVAHPLQDVRNDNTVHLPAHSDVRGRCLFCAKGQSRWKYGKCKIFLCLKASDSCFAAYRNKDTWSCFNPYAMFIVLLFMTHFFGYLLFVAKWAWLMWTFLLKLSINIPKNKIPHDSTYFESKTQFVRVWLAMLFGKGFS